ncbi:MAG: S-methyl-5-thioribose-1-phosphate isomerase [Armatimonadetes bacterium]|nr:S-methyl-5-thioribose-1-phosphate isomerase [Armatimonadota bacterium]
MSQLKPTKILQTVAWESGRLRLIDQNALPSIMRYLDYTDWRDVVEAIRTMVVRGAPAIGCTAALGIAMAARNQIAEGREAFLERLEPIAERFRTARPTAVNLMWAVDRLMNLARNTSGSVVDIKDALMREALAMLDEDLTTNRRLGWFGADLLSDNSNVLTHCNAGALATVGYGTALGVIRAAVEMGKNVHVYADETRPRLQGMKLTAWEMVQEGIPVTVIADNMAASLMRQGRVDAVVVGADRIASNGDTANKIGTYSLAVIAHHHNIPFYVAAPLSTIDRDLPNGLQIPIEQRDTREMTHIGETRIAPEGVNVLNPAFDVTPAELISAIITEEGVLRPQFTHSIEAAFEISRKVNP